ncbi:transcription factor Tfb2-domain-containing protein [Piptocephalis cylindrospora]|uniref:RNA polymerase II transcription factor B subunit 2 n=1 Tax=Piptocephalis cylindrospora TaxID=1907219 RepID=A0A4P9Y548_9FUNG|nr:transcription factor Tfb2-domain-containing protein [Piptocephalis cylindrospora]|eukprot:RKP13822.1 transcription factor Tfb2-domain-containing protein [Piptocephalis cylindrospora]
MSTPGNPRLFRTSVSEYLESLAPGSLARLYANPASTLAVFRLLPVLSKHLVMSLLYLPTPVHVSHVTAWTTLRAETARETALKPLYRLHIVQEGKTLLLEETFRKALQSALAGRGSECFGTPSSTKDKYAVDKAFLTKHSEEKWGRILHFMVGTDEAQPSNAARKLLERSGLMAPNMSTGRLAITQAGFQFVLQDRYHQVWGFLLQYMEFIEGLQLDLVEVLHLLFQLGGLTFGQDYGMETFTQTQMLLLEDLQNFGLVYRRKKTSRRFYPTRLATTLTSGAEGGQEEGNEGFIILETNYRLYAYTDSPLKIAILNLFCSLKARFANMVSGSVTRESVRRALSNGITADQIIQYLTANAHPHTRHQNPILPLTVVDQVRLWELERDRFTAKSGVLYTGFQTKEDFTAVLQYARQLEVLLWNNYRSMIIARDGDESVRAFSRRRDERRRDDHPVRIKEEPR